jgi:DNA (cytosine-5)-methyltransferase 1
MEHKFNYKWTLKDANFTKDKGKVFSCFACGGGSTMGYKLAGFDVIGCNEIDKKMIEIYKKNHNPKYAFCEPIQEFKNKEELPEELFNLDILDGSPPCSTFSIAGQREQNWGEMKCFREGQSEQVLDTLFFDFIDLAKRLQPKVVVAENVKGLLVGDAKEYVRKIYQEFDNAGFYCQHFCLDASKMGVPQKRERVFFVCLRKDLAQPFLVQKNIFDTIPLIEMEFNEEPITFGEFADYKGTEIKSKNLRHCWNNRILDDNSMSDTNKRLFGVEKYFNNKYDKDDKVCYTFTSANNNVCFSHPCKHSTGEILSISTFPIDYDFGKEPVHYVCGMSVPPVMMAQVASNIYEQWFSKM